MKTKKVFTIWQRGSGIQLAELTAEIEIFNAMQDRVIVRDCRSRVGTIPILVCRFHEFEVCVWTPGNRVRSLEVASHFRLECYLHYLVETTVLSRR